MKASTIIWTVLGVVVIGLLIWWIFSLFNAEPDTPLNVPENGEVTLQGRIVCLPHRDESGPQTLECAYGLQGEDSNYYGLEGTGVGGNVTQYPTDTEVEVKGVFTLGEDERYATVGVIEVESITATDGTPNPNESSISDGTIIFSQPADFGLAVTNDQVLVTGVIPPCTSEFSYCLYYNGSQYENTNFVSSGVSIRKRDDLSTESACLTTQPSGYTALESSTSTGSGYAMSLFAPLDDAGAGSYSTGEDYRLYASSTCYELVTRVGESQFANYPEGSITEFTEQNRNSLLDTLRTIVGSIRLEPDDTQISLPAEIE